MTERGAKTLGQLRACAMTHEPQSCIVGNVTAGDTLNALSEMESDWKLEREWAAGHRILMEQLEQQIAQVTRELAAANQRAEAAEKEQERLRDVLHMDRSGLANGLGKVRDVVRGYGWLANVGEWGLYDGDEHTEATLRKEIADCLDMIESTATQTIKDSGDLAHAECCGRKRRELPLERQVNDLTQQVDRMRTLLREIEWNRHVEGNACPSCNRSQSRGHSATCKLVAALSAPATSKAESKASESLGVAAIAAERQRQISGEGWDPEHDDEHACEEMALAAATYATPAKWRSLTTDCYGDPKPAMWPCRWWPNWWKPTPNDRKRELVKAGALIAAEYDRLLRADGAQPAQPEGESGEGNTQENKA